MRKFALESIKYIITATLGCLITLMITGAWTNAKKMNQVATKDELKQTEVSCNNYTDKQVGEIKAQSRIDKMELLNAIESVRLQNDRNTDRIISTMTK